MEIILGFLFELIVDGALEAFPDKKVPLPLRIIAGIILIGVYGGLIGLCFFLGIHDRNWIVLILGVIILIFTIFGIRSVYKKHKH